MENILAFFAVKKISENQRYLREKILMRLPYDFPQQYLKNTYFSGIKTDAKNELEKFSAVAHIGRFRGRDCRRNPLSGSKAAAGVNVDIYFCLLFTPETPLSRIYSTARASYLR